MLSAGTKFGPYEIVAAVGAGGMGEVYRAKDSRLGREVAIKVLPASFLDDPDRRARFEREAQAVAALSHPNVIAIFDTGLHESQLYVVMELLSGQNLRDRLAGGAMPVRKAVDVAVQIARGLGAAHGKGLVHRDLKPENVFLLDDGQVKILDFGLARQTADPTVHSGATQTMAATDPGTVMGTMGYMAPEQVRGQAVDARADVFAFGAVLYEMIAGQRAFQRDTAADSMTAILTQDPPELAGSRPDVPAAFDRIIRHCLEKNPNERFQSARDVAFALEALSGSSPSGAVSATTAAGAHQRRGVPMAVAGALVLAAAAAGVGGGAMFGTSPAAPLTFTMKTFESLAIFNARFMPDGESIVFSGAPTGSTPFLYEVRTGALESRRFGPDGTHLLSVSSKGELAVLTNASYVGHRLFRGTLSRMALEGAPRPWLDNVREADWNPDGTTVAVIRDLGRGDQLEYPAGTKLYESGGYLSDPRVSPDGTRVAFMEHPTRFDDRGYVKVVNTAGVVTTLAGEFWGEEGLAWVDGGTAVMFAASAQSALGREPGDLSYQIYRVPADGAGAATFALTSPGDFTIYDVSRSGVWLATRDDGRYGVVARGAGQSVERDLSWLNKNWSPTLSGDGERLLFADGNGGSDYAVVWRKVDGSPVARLGDGTALSWSPDGKWALGLILSVMELVAYPSGAGDSIRLNTLPVKPAGAAGWFPDSQHIAFAGNEPGKPQRLYKMAIGGGPPTPILPADVVFAFFLSDGASAVAWTTAGAVAIYPLNGGPARPVATLDPLDTPTSITDDGRALIVTRGQTIPLRLDRIDLTTGARTLFRELAPADSAGVTRLIVEQPVLKADGSQYAYAYVKRLSTLFTVRRADR